MTDTSFVNLHMGVHEATRLLAPWGDWIDIDNGMIPLITDLWANGVRTTDCCEGFRERLGGGWIGCPHHVAVWQCDYSMAYLVVRRHGLTVQDERRSAFGVSMIFDD